MCKLQCGWRFKCTRKDERVDEGEKRANSTNIQTRNRANTGHVVWHCILGSPPSPSLSESLICSVSPSSCACRRTFCRMSIMWLRMIQRKMELSISLTVPRRSPARPRIFLFITSSSPSRHVGCEAVGIQILMSCSSPLVASTEHRGCGSRQLIAPMSSAWTTCRTFAEFLSQRKTWPQSDPLTTNSECAP